jgi:hypothetical protein
VKGLEEMSQIRLAEDHYRRAATYYIREDNPSAMSEVKRALELRPTYLEALQLEEKIMSIIAPEELEMRKNIKDLERQYDPNWVRK